MSTASDLHNSILSIDTHIDIPYPNGPSFFEEGRRNVDLPKMKRGHMAAGIFIAYVGQGPRTEETNEAAFAKAVAMLEFIKTMGAQGARHCTTVAAIEKAFADGVTIVIPAVENGQACGGVPARLKRFRELGATYLTLTHFGHNALGDSSNPRRELNDPEEEHGGLSALGREAVDVLNRVGMLVDIAHTSKKTMMQAAMLSRTPVLSTHSCLKHFNDNPRNLDDEQLDMLQSVGGVVQITAVPSFLKKDGKIDTVTVSDYCDQIDYAVKRIGVEHVGISSDFDGGGGFKGWRDASETGNITAELVKRGYGRTEISLLWGGNFLRLLRLAESRAE